jgi:hypothetical protein
MSQSFLYLNRPLVESVLTPYKLEIFIKMFMK